MFTPSRAKVEAATIYLEGVRKRPRSFTSFRNRSDRGHGPLWRNLPKGWHAQANSDLNRLVAKFWSDHGRAPSQQKLASLIGNVVRNIRYCRMSSLHLTFMWRFWNARAVVRGNKNVKRPNDRTSFTPRTSKARSSSGNLVGI